MTTINLGQLWLARADDLTDVLAVPFNVESAESWPVPIKRWDGAAGRQRAVRTPRRRPTWTPKVGRLPLDTIRALQERTGVEHWARDPLGGKVLCFWDDVAVVWRGAEGRGHAQVGLITWTLQAVTAAETSQVLPVGGL